MTIKNHIFPDGNRTIFLGNRKYPWRKSHHTVNYMAVSWWVYPRFLDTTMTCCWLYITFHFNYIPWYHPNEYHFFQFYIFNCIQHAHRLGGKSTSLSTNPSKISRWLHSVVARVSLNIPGILGGFQGSLLVNPRLQWTLVPIQSLKIVCLGIHEMIHSPCGKL